MEDIVSGSVLRPDRDRENTTVTGGVEVDSENSNVNVKGDKSVFKQSSDELGKQEFLNLLITSLRYQDPLNPASNEQFISQMAQFSALEATQNTNKSIGDMAGSLEELISHQTNTANTMSGAASTNLLGKTVRMGHGEFDYYGQPVKFDVHVNDGEVGFLSVVNEKNEVVNVVEMLDTKGTVTDGDFLGNTWDGTQADGTQAEAGKYHFEVTTQDGSRDVGYVYVENVVTGITYAPEGTLLTVGGKERLFSDIIHVSQKNTDNNSSEVKEETVDNQGLNPDIVKVDSEIFSQRE